VFESGYYPSIYVGELGKITITSVIILGVPTRIRTQHLSNTNKELYNHFPSAE
jgi:hypothetical protein